MQPLLKPPFRSPEVVANNISDIIKDKVVCELGCAEGDNLLFMSKYAKKVIGFEFMERRYSVARQRNFEVVVGNYYTDPIPDADVYYFWPDDGESDNEFLIQRILELPDFKGTIIVGADTGFKPEVPCLERCSKWGELRVLPYNEGIGPRENGIFILAVIDTLKLKQQCTFLLSSPRSGSSCTTGAFNICGVSLGRSVTTVKDQFNPKGYFENQKILTFNEKVLRAIGSSIFMVGSLSQSQIDSSFLYQKELEDIIKAEYLNDKFFMIKDPRISILQDLYKKTFKDLGININVVLLTRDSVNASNSINRMTGINFEMARTIYISHYNLIDKFLMDTEYTKIVFEDFLQDSNSILKRACYDLKIPYGFGRHRKKEISSFVDKQLLTYK